VIDSNGNLGLLLEFGWLGYWINSTIGSGILAFMRFSRIGNQRLFQQNLTRKVALAVLVQLSCGELL
jgi:hypothetical protein